MKRYIKTTLNPDAYHGAGQKPPFFEGWYFKIADCSAKQTFAIIPGVFFSKKSAESHAFVQILDGKTGAVSYCEYPLNDFKASDGVFEVQLGKNRFAANKATLDIEQNGVSISGELSFQNITLWPVTLASPGIMGWYAWAPFMECFHGVVSLDHSISGSLNYNGKEISFDGGRGYIEKDWGRSFPGAWVWLQSNHFSQTGTSLTASIAIIPWLRGSFLGYIAGLWHEGVLHRFTTYTGAKVDHLEIKGKDVAMTLSNKTHILEIGATRTSGGLLQAPSVDGMDRQILETIGSTVEMHFKTRDGKTIFQGVGENGGLEVEGDLERLMEMWRKS